MMNGQEKSDFGVVAEKPANNGGEPSAERAEPRPETKGNAGQQSTHRAQDRARVTQALDRVRQASPSTTRGRSHMRESRPCGSERGAPSNGRPYREVRQESWRVPTGESPVRVRGSARPVASVAAWKATTVKRRSELDPLRH